MEDIQQLKELNSRLKEENDQLKIRVKELEEKLYKQNSFFKPNDSILQQTVNEVPLVDSSNSFDNDLTLAEYMRYGRQLILPGFGKSGILLFYFILFYFI